MKQSFLLIGLAGLMMVACETTDGATTEVAANDTDYSSDAADRIKARGQDPDQMVCKNESVPGSTIPRRVCMTRAEREEQRLRAKDSVDGIQRKGLQTPDPNAG